jgi:hypothetical protein
MGYAGIDIGKDARTATIITATARIRDRLDFTNRPDGFAELAARLRPRDRLVMEADTYVYLLHDHLMRLGFKVLVADPGGIKEITASDKKTNQYGSQVRRSVPGSGTCPWRTCRTRTSCATARICEHEISRRSRGGRQTGRPRSRWRIVRRQPRNRCSRFRSVNPHGVGATVRRGWESALLANDRATSKG